MRRLRVLAVVLVLAFACQKEPTEIAFVVTTDLDCSKIADTIITVGIDAEVERKTPSTVSTVCTDGKIGTLVVIPSGDDNAEVGVRVVTGVAKSAEKCASEGLTGGCIVARRSLRFIPGTSVRVPIDMRASCIDVSCTDAVELSTCVKGQCVPAHCTGDGCDEESLARNAPNTDTGADAASSEAGVDGDIDGAVSAGDGTWSPIATAPNGAPRAYATAVWTGAQAIFFGGDIGPGGYGRDGWAYDVAGNSWSLVETPDGDIHLGHNAVWTGSEMLAWGGYGANATRNTGAAWDPVGRTWRPIAQPPFPFAGRARAAAVWTGKEMIIWGGTDGNDNSLADGAAFDPKTNIWRQLEASPLDGRFGPGVTWDGTKMYIFGGQGDGGCRNDAASYDPATGQWTTLPVNTIAPRSDVFASAIPGPRSIFFGGIDFPSGIEYGNGTIFDPATSQWTPVGVPPASVLEMRVDAAMWFGRGRLWQWGGAPFENDVADKDDGASYAIADKSWTKMPAGGPSARVGAQAVWIGDRAIIWGGIHHSAVDGGTKETPLADGMSFTPK